MPPGKQTQFELFGLEHFSILIITITILLLLVSMVRSRPNSQLAQTINYSLALVLLLNYLAYVSYRIWSGHWHVRYDLPMEFCDWATFLAIIALITRNQLIFELAFFGIVAGSLQGLITPDLNKPFGHIQYFIFFIGHCGIVITAFYLLWGLKMTPRKNSSLRVFAYSQIYFLSALLISYLVDGNYGYMMAPPRGASLIDYLGPWPYYLISLQAIALLFYSLIYLPFFILRKWGRL